MSKQITKAELKEFGKDKDACYIAIKGKVYNVRNFLVEHPGGGEIIEEHKGKDATTEFLDIGHSDYAEDLLEPFYIGDLVE